MKEVIFTAKDKTKIFCTLWDNVKNPVGVVQIIHGMNEHVGRYDIFAKFLNKNGFIVFGDDHRAHGRTATSIEKIGTLDGNKDLFNATVSDELEIINFLTNKYKLPLFLFGHSYGSFLTQAVIEKTNKHTAVCLCGSAKFWGWYLLLAKAVSWIGITLFGKNSPANIIEVFSPIRKKRNNGNVLTRDSKKEKSHFDDKFFKDKFSYGFYYYMFSNLLKLNRKVSKNIPMLIISGSKDAVGMNGKLAKKLYNTYKAAGVRNLNIKLYKDAKHELLNEINYKEVQNDVLNFFLSAL